MPRLLPQRQSCPRGPWARRVSRSPFWTRGLARARCRPAAPATVTPHGVRAFDTVRRPISSEAAFKKMVPAGPRRPQANLPRHQGHPEDPRPDILGMLDKRLAALGTDYVDLFFIHSFGDYHSLDDAMAIVKSKELKEASEAVQEVGQGQTGGHLDPPQGPCPVHPGGGRGRDRRRDHAPVPPLARQGLRRSTRRSTPPQEVGSA